MQALRIRGLRKTYGNGVEALKGIDLDVEAGDFFGLLGPNGAGKSTAIGIVSSLVNKTAGSVEVFGVDLDADRVAAKRMIGLVPQEVNFNQFERPDQIVAQQAGYYGVPWKRAKERAEECLRAMGLWEKREVAARELSGGMKRRLMIARALVHKPRLLILDEPTAGVDIELRRTTWRLMEEINRGGTTVILTTHYLEEAESLCRRIAIIDRGTIVENTDTKSLLAKLSMETFVIDPSEPLRELPRIESYPARLRPDGSLEVDVARDQGLNHLFRQLEAAGIAVASMRNKANRLEELFVRMVEGEEGRSATVAAS
jgi:ABC-2 type transport system ATP-binding protein